MGAGTRLLVITANPKLASVGDKIAPKTAASQNDRSLKSITAITVPVKITKGMAAPNKRLGS